MNITSRIFNTQDKVKDVISLYVPGFGVKNIANKYKCSGSTVCRLLKNNNVAFRIKQPNFDPTEEQISDIISKYESGVTAKKISNFYKISTSPILKLLNAYNVDMRIAADYKNYNRRIFFDQTFFDEIDTEAKAYFLGFLMADGCVHSNKRFVFLGLNVKDHSIIKKFAEVTNYPVDNIKFINSFNKNYNKFSKRSCIWFNSKHMVNSLAKHGCVSNKTHKLIISNTIPDNMIRHFCRGFFDGDGCICRNSQNIDGSWGKKVKVSGDHKFLKLYNNVVKLFVGISASGIYKNTHTYDLVYSKKDDLIKLASWFYDDSSIYLERKRSRFYSAGGELYGRNI